MKALSDLTVPGWLQSRKLFETMCGGVATWTFCPAFPCPTFSAATSAQDAVKGEAMSSSNISALSQNWERRHGGVRSLPKDVAVAPVRHVPCRFRTCVCRGTRKTLLTKLVSYLKQHSQTELTGGDIILRLSASGSTTSTRACQKRKQQHGDSDAPVWALV